MVWCLTEPSHYLMQWCLISCSSVFNCLQSQWNALSIQYYNILQNYISKISAKSSNGQCVRKCSADSRYASSQWDTSLQSNAVSHRLGANVMISFMKQPLMRSRRESYLFCSRYRCDNTRGPFTDRELIKVRVWKRYPICGIQLFMRAQTWISANAGMGE